MNCWVWCVKLPEVRGTNLFGLRTDAILTDSACPWDTCLYFFLYKSNQPPQTIYTTYKLIFFLTVVPFRNCIYPCMIMTNFTPENTEHTLPFIIQSPFKHRVCSALGGRTCNFSNFIYFPFLCLSVDEQACLQIFHIWYVHSVFPYLFNIKIHALLTPCK